MHGLGVAACRYHAYSFHSCTCPLLLLLLYYYLRDLRQLLLQPLLLPPGELIHLLHLGHLLLQLTPAHAAQPLRAALQPALQPAWQPR